MSRESGPKTRRSLCHLCATTARRTDTGRHSGSHKSLKTRHNATGQQWLTRRGPGSNPGSPTKQLLVSQSIYESRSSGPATICNHAAHSVRAGDRFNVAGSRIVIMQSEYAFSWLGPDECEVVHYNGQGYRLHTWRFKHAGQMEWRCPQCASETVRQMVRNMLIERLKVTGLSQTLSKTAR